jgi:uncharacterized membrane protein
VTLVAFLGIDMVWLGFVARDVYRTQMGDLVAPSFRLAPAVIFYALYAVGIVYFAILPALRDGQPTQAILAGAFLGLIAYGTYDLTNLAVVRGWPLQLSLIDLAWGAVLTACAAGLGAYAALQVR